MTQIKSWLEFPLISDHPVSFWCAVCNQIHPYDKFMTLFSQVTLPTPVTFKRGLSIPYFVVFMTKPGSADLAEEIAADATISVSLLRKVTTTKQVQLPPSPPETPADENDVTKGKLLKRSRSRQLLSKASAISLQGSGQVFPDRDRSLPRLPTEVVFYDTKTLKNDVCIGFPKRPRHLRYPGRHLTLEEIETLPDGLFRSKILLKDDLLPSIDVEGLNVKVHLDFMYTGREILTSKPQYYLDVSVLFGQDDLHAQIPIRVV